MNVARSSLGRGQTAPGGEFTFGLFRLKRESTEDESEWRDEDAMLYAGDRIVRNKEDGCAPCARANREPFRNEAPRIFGRNAKGSVGVGSGLTRFRDPLTGRFCTERIPEAKVQARSSISTSSESSLMSRKEVGSVSECNGGVKSISESAGDIAPSRRRSGVGGRSSAPSGEPHRNLAGSPAEKYPSARRKIILAWIANSSVERLVL